MSRFRSLGLFLYDFVVGDDWHLAVGVVLAIAAAALVAAGDIAAWWVLPLAVVVLLYRSLRRATRATPSS